MVRAKDFLSLILALALAAAQTSPAIAIEGFQEHNSKLRGESQKDLTAADKALEEKKYQLAIELYSKAIDAKAVSGEELGRAYLQRGVAYQLSSDCANAIADFDRALETMPGKAEVYFNRALCRNQLRQADLAVADLDAAIKIDPTSPIYRATRCGALFNMQDFARALPDCEVALAASPNDKTMLLAVGQSAERLGNKAKAAAAYRHLLEVEPGNALAAAGLSRVS